jgi:hypothetical protein
MLVLISIIVEEQKRRRFLAHLWDVSVGSKEDL